MRFADWILSSSLVPLLLVVLMSRAAVAAAAPGDSPPTMQEIQQSFQSQDYQGVIKQVSAVLPLKGEAAQGYDRAVLLALKAESHLQLKQFQPAAEAYNLAAEETGDDSARAVLKANSILIRRASAGKYQPKQPTSRPSGSAGTGGKPEPIDITDPAGRRQALEALFNDELKLVSGKIELLRRQTALPPLMKGVEQVGDLRTLEVAATGSDQQSKQFLSGLAGQAAQIMSAGLKQMGQTVEKLSKEANTSRSVDRVQPSGYRQTVVTKRGLISNEKNMLNSVIKTAKDIAAACDEMGKAMQADQDAFASVKSEASALAERADEVLHADYSTTVNGQSRQTIPQRGGQQRQGQRPGQGQQPGQGGGSN